ncbi:MAG: hypothetical protein RLZZ362_1667, partial [Actinomycetota bacterium]
AACSSDADSSRTSTTPATTPEAAPETTTVATTAAAASGEATFTAEVWVDNWFSLTVNGVVIGEDSVSITTERSFNSETFTFTATYPLTIALVSKDYKETDSGLEYIGEPNQQMGDGGVIAQITDTATGTVVAVTGTDWQGLVIHRAPLDKRCVTSSDPDTDCAFEAIDEPAGWTEPGFDDSAWAAATAYTEEEVGVKDGYLDIDWDPAATLIWTSDLQADNTILWRTTVTAP